MGKMKFFYFIIIGSLLIFMGCSSMSAREMEDNSVAVSNNSLTPERYAALIPYDERLTTVIKNPSVYNPEIADKIILNDDYIKIILYAKEFAQGNAGYFEVVPENGVPADVKKVLFDGEDIPFTKTSWGYRGFFAVAPEAKPGKTFFAVIYSTSTGTGVKKIEGTVNISDVKYPVGEYLLDLGKFSDKEYISRPEFKKLIKESAEARRKAFSIVSDDAVINTLSHPRDMHKVTGNYWKKRIYAAYKKKGKKKVKVRGHVSYHRGLDLKGDVGAPVFSMADGRIVLAREMFYEGNMVVVDHGNKVFTYYMHMDSFNVRVGDSVKAGDMIGRVGSTGSSTASHLHVALSIRGVHVHPLSLLSLPVSR